MPEDEKKTSIMNSTIDVKWLVAMLIPLIGWCISIEVRLSSGLPQRVTNLEIALQPVLIDYGVDKELEARGIKVDTITPPVAGPVIPKSSKEEIAKRFRLEQETKLKEQFPNAYKK